jgi:ElaB/YqjD/DUF883 family membrane-anchored ribosome-binding protein
MATQNILRATEQLKTGLTDGIEKLKDFSEDARDRFEAARKDLKRGIKTTQTAVRDAAQATRRKVGERPLTALAATALTGLALGFTLGWLMGHKRRS